MIAPPPPYVPIDNVRIELPAGYQASTPIFTGDGKHLLFSSGGELHLIGANGRGLSCLTCGVAGHPGFEPAVQEAFKDVFPDGRRVLWGDFEHAYVLECRPSVLQCDQRTLLPVDISAGAPSGGPLGLGGGVWHLAPDGRHLGWTVSRLDTRVMLVGSLQRQADRYAASGVKVVNPPGPSSLTDTDPRGWTNGGGLYELKGFADGGRSVTYVSSQFEGNPDVFSVNLRSGRVTRVTANPDWDEDDGMSPDGRSLVIYSDRGMRRVEAGGLVPRRAFIDYPLSANFAIYYVGHTEGFQCDLQPWLLPASGDGEGKLLGQPLAPYSGGDLHPQNNVPGRGAWSPDSTQVAVTEMSYKTGLGSNRLLIARLHRPPTKAQKIVSSTVGSWAVGPADYHGVTDSNTTVTVRGLRSGTAVVKYSGSIASGSFSVAYSHYSDDGKSFVDGVEKVDAPGIGQMPAVGTSDVEISGSHKGYIHAHFSIGRTMGKPTATGSGDTKLDGYRLKGPIPKIGACPAKLPKPQPLKIRVNSGGRVVVTANSAPLAHRAGGFGDLRPVAGAVVRSGSARAVTDSHGVAHLPPGSRRIVATAGDTFLRRRSR